MESLGKDLDKFAEIDTSLSDVVEDSFDFISLILNISNLHIESHLGRNLARLNHRVVLQRYGLLPALDVVGLGLAVNLLVLAIEGGETRATNLLGNHIARERDDTDVVSGRSLDGHDVATLQIEIIYVLVI